MWLTVAVAALGAGFQLFGQARQNNALKREANANITKAEADNELGVLRADAAYLGALDQNTQTAAQAAQAKTQLEANQKRLQTVGIIAAGILIVIITIVAIVKTNKS